MASGERLTASRLVPAVLVAGLLLALACDSDDRPPVVRPTSTAVSPSSAAAVQTPDPRFAPAFHDFVRQIDAALAGQDIDFFRSRVGQTTPVVCTAENTPPREPGNPACEAVGQEFEGFSVGEHRAPGGPPPPAVLGAIVPVTAAMEMISRLWSEEAVSASDRYGSSTPTVYAIGTDASDAAKRSYTTVLTGMIERPADIGGSGPLRISLVLTWAPETDDFSLVFLLYAFFQAGEWLDRSPVTVERMPVWERLQQ